MVKPAYGSSSINYLEEMFLLLEELKPRSVLDFGCGKARLIGDLAGRYPAVEFYGYDPAIPGRDTLPVSEADLVICTDVLEHIPEKELEGIVAQVASLSPHAFFMLHHGLAVEILPDGTNAHCTVKTAIWYYELFSRYFSTITMLPGRKLNTSILLTFGVSPNFFNKYNELLKQYDASKLDNLEIRLHYQENQLLEIEQRLNRVWKWFRPLRGVRRILRGDFGPVKTVLKGIKKRII